VQVLPELPGQFVQLTAAFAAGLAVNKIEVPGLRASVHVPEVEPFEATEQFMLLPPVIVPEELPAAPEIVNVYCTPVPCSAIVRDGVSGSFELISRSAFFNPPEVGENIAWTVQLSAGPYYDLCSRRFAG